MNPDIQSAIERAKAVAAKLSSQMPPGSSQKRPLDSNDLSPTNKKFASVDDAVGANLAMLKAQQNGQIIEEMKVPDKMVGLIIGKGGSQLHQLQDETNCKVSIAPKDPNITQSERIFTIYGRDRQAISICRKRIEDIVRRGGGERDRMDNGGGGGGGHGGGGNVEVMEMLIPGNRCGVVIGKGGETIKRLNEEYGVKLVLIQDAETPLNADKPLRITGEPDRVARAKDAVMALINPPMPPGGRGGFRGDRGDDRGEYGSRRGGDRYDDRRGRDDGRGGFGGRDDSRGSFGGGGGGGGAGFGGKDPSFASTYGMPQCTIKVPGDRAGFVIGKGGETIKDINRRSGAHVEIDRNSRDLPNGSDKHFNIRGLPEQIQYAQQLIYEKITGVPGSVPPQGYFGPGSEIPGLGQGGFSQNLWAQSDPNSTAAWTAYYQQIYGQMGGMPGAAPTSAGGSTPDAAKGAQSASSLPTAADYSQQWIEYYRSLGMHEQADAIVKQIQIQQQGQTPSSTANANGNGGPTSGEQQKQSSNGSSSSAGGSSAAADAQWQNYQQQYGGYSNYKS